MLGCGVSFQSHCPMLRLHRALSQDDDFPVHGFNHLNETESA